MEGQGHRKMMKLLDLMICISPTIGLEEKPKKIGITSKHGRSHGNVIYLLDSFVL